MRLGEGKPRACLVGPPNPIGPARALAVGTEVTMGASLPRARSRGTQPLLAREDAAITRWGILRRRVVSAKCRVGPGAADPAVKRPDQCARHGAQPTVGEIHGGRYW